jgi:hypothetical protein
VWSRSSPNASPTLRTRTPSPGSLTRSRRTSIPPSRPARSKDVPPMACLPTTPSCSKLGRSSASSSSALPVVVPLTASSTPSRGSKTTLELTKSSARGLSGLTGSFAGFVRSSLLDTRPIHAPWYRPSLSPAGFSHLSTTSRRRSSSKTRPTSSSTNATATTVSYSSTRHRTGCKGLLRTH